MLAIGVALAGGGFYLALVSLGLARSPSHINGPNWLGFAAGLVFFAGGLSVLVRASLRVPDKQPHLPDNAPAIAVVMQWLAALTIIAELASIGTWIAFGAGTRQFSISLPVWGSLAEMIGSRCVWFRRDTHLADGGAHDLRRSDKAFRKEELTGPA